MTSSHNRILEVHAAHDIERAALEGPLEDLTQDRLSRRVSARIPQRGSEKALPFRERENSQLCEYPDGQSRRERSIIVMLAYTWS